MPKRVRGVVGGLIALGAFGLLVSLMALGFGDDRAAAVFPAIWAPTGIAAGLMIWQRVPGAKALAILFAIPMFAAFPVGTVVAWKLVSDVVSPECSKYLAK